MDIDFGPENEIFIGILYHSRIQWTARNNGADISSDGSTLYFVSIDSVLGPGFGKADIWQVSLNLPKTKERN